MSQQVLSKIVGIFKDEIVNNSVKTCAMAVFYTSVEWQNHCFDWWIVKFQKFQILGVADDWGKTILMLCYIWHRILWWLCKDLAITTFYKVFRMINWLFWWLNSEISKIPNSGRGRWLGQNNPYFVLYLRWKTLMIV